MTRRKLLQKLWLAPAALLAGCAVRGRPTIDPRIYHDRLSTYDDFCDEQVCEPPALSHLDTPWYEEKDVEWFKEYRAQYPHDQRRFYQCKY